MFLQTYNNKEEGFEYVNLENVIAVNYHKDTKTIEFITIGADKIVPLVYPVTEEDAEAIAEELRHVL